MDGVNLTSSQRGEIESQVHYNWLEQAQVTGLGAPAEYGGSTGATVNGVLRSGSNRVAGMGELLTVRPTWTGNNLGDLPADVSSPVTPQTILTWWDANGQLGGPLVRNRLFAFGGYGQLHHEHRPFGFGGPGQTDEKTSHAIVKIDAVTLPGLLFQGFVTREASDVVGGGVSQRAPSQEASADGFSRTHAWNARMSLILSPTTLLEARTGGNTGATWASPHPPATMDGPSPQTDAYTGIHCCNSGHGRNERSAVLGTVTLSHHREAFWGRHDLKAGFEFERALAR